MRRIKISMSGKWVIIKEIIVREKCKMWHMISALEVLKALPYLLASTRECSYLLTQWKNYWQKTKCKIDNRAIF